MRDRWADSALSAIAAVRLPGAEPGEVLAEVAVEPVEAGEALAEVAAEPERDQEVVMAQVVDRPMVCRVEAEEAEEVVEVMGELPVPVPGRSRSVLQAVVLHVVALPQ